MTGTRRTRRPGSIPIGACQFPSRPKPDQGYLHIPISVALNTRRRKRSDEMVLTVLCHDYTRPEEEIIPSESKTPGGIDKSGGIMGEGSGDGDKRPKFTQ